MIYHQIPKPNLTKFEIQQKKSNIIIISYPQKSFSSTSPPKIKYKKMNDQQTCQFLFKITSIDIVSNGKIKTNLNTSKSILIKLGNKQIKCKNIKQSIQMNIDVLYSKNFNKYYPVKGIIKVYDINKDGSQTISCVGALNTQDLISEKPKTTTLQRDIGPCKVYLTVQVQKIDKLQTIQQPEKQASANNVQKNKQIQIPKETIGKDLSLRNLHKKFTKSPQITSNQHLQIPVPYLIDDSNQHINDISSMKCSQLSQDIKINEKEMLGQQLVLERRKNKTLQDKLQKTNIKIQLLRKYLTQKNNEIKLYCNNFKNFTAGLESDSKGQYIFEMNERKRQVSLRYKQNIKFKQIFEQFIAFIIKKMLQNNGIVGSDKTIQQQSQINRITIKLQNLQNEKKKYIQENSKLINQLISLRQQLNLKKIQISNKQLSIKNFNQSVNLLQDKIKKISDQKKQFQGLNQYLQQRDTQMQSIIISKQSTIQNLTKILTQNNTQLHSLQQKNAKLLKIIDNFQLTIQQMRQQNANLSQTIESYQLTFGDLKQTKNKALQRQIKQCLRWIDQQNRDQQLSLEDTTLTFSQSPAVTSIRRSIGQIENMPLQQISLIRKQVIGVLKRLDQFVAKNSLGVVSA